jgi:hypothetical protein
MSRSLSKGIGKLRPLKKERVHPDYLPPKGTKGVSAIKRACIRGCRLWKNSSR